MVYKKFNKIELIISISTSIFIFLLYFLFNFNYLTDWVDERFDSNTYRRYAKWYLFYEEYLNKRYPEGYNRKDLPVNIQEELLKKRFDLVNPHHIAFDTAGILFYKYLKNKGFNGNNFNIYNAIKRHGLDDINYENIIIEYEMQRAFQLRNLLISSIGLALIFFFLYKISKKYFLSLIIVILIGFSCGYWMYSQINDTPIIHSVFLVLLFFLSIYFPQCKRKYLYSIFLALFHAVTVFFHQSDFIFIFVISFIILFSKNFINNDENKNLKNNISFIDYSNTVLKESFSFKIYHIRYFIIYLSVLLLTISIAYYYAGLVFIGCTLDKSKALITLRGFRDHPTYFFNWLTLYVGTGHWGKGFEGNTLYKVTKGISSYFYESDLSFKGRMLNGNINNFFAPDSILPNITGFFIFFIFIFTIIFSYFLFKEYRYVFIANIIFLLIYFIFAAWWEPDYREFWVAPMFAFWIISFLVLNFIINKLKFIKPIPVLFIYSYLFLFGFLLFYINFTGFLYKNASNEFRKVEIINEEYNLPVEKKSKSN